MSFPNSTTSSALFEPSNLSTPSESTSLKRKRQCQNDKLLQDKKIAVKANFWTKEEDGVLLEEVKKHGYRWVEISGKLDGRSGKSCRTRWVHLSRPIAGKGLITDKEKIIILASLYDSSCQFDNKRNQSGFAYRWTDIAKRVNVTCHQNQNIRSDIAIRDFVLKHFPRFALSLPKPHQLSKILTPLIHNNLSFLVGLQQLVDFPFLQDAKLPEPLPPSSEVTSSQMVNSFGSALPESSRVSNSLSSAEPQLEEQPFVDSLRLQEFNIVSLPKESEDLIKTSSQSNQNCVQKIEEEDDFVNKILA